MTSKPPASRWRAAMRSRPMRWFGLSAAAVLAICVCFVAAGNIPAAISQDAPASSKQMHIPQNHIAEMRAQILRIHRGKVDKAALRRISSHIADIQKAAFVSDSAAMADSAIFTSPAQNSGGPAAAGFIPAAFTQSWTEDGLKSRKPAMVAQNTPPPAQPASAQPPEPAGRTFVGQKTCETCHQQEASNWAHTIHAKLFDFHPQNATQAEGCEACHGPGSDHIKNPTDFTTIISFSSKSKTPVARQNAQCLSCHKGGQRIFWHDSVHESNNLSCADCHNPMANFAAHGLTARQSINETCFQCHKVQRMEFNERSHMPLPEGKISCADCHNPHGSTTAPLLKADSVNELCYSCHADKRGPFLFEHAPVRENCLNCHNPHGSNFESLLNVPRPLLCQQCHTQDGHPAQLLTAGNLARGARPDPRVLSTSCQTCHVNIHGSNDPSGARFER